MISDVRPEVVQTDFVSQAMALGGPGAMARTNDPTTSHQAADSISSGAREASERYVLEVLADRGPLTDEMIQHVYLMHESSVWDRYGHEFSPSRLRTARKQLVDKGLVIDSGLTAKTRSGRVATEWMVTE